jgi:hypothetical protein
MWAACLGRDAADRVAAGRSSAHQVLALQSRPQCHCCERGAGGFHVMEVWIENSGMVELLPPAFATEYLMLTRRRGVHAA